MKITEEQAGERLDKFLTKELGDETRSQIQKMIDNGFVLVNGVQKKSNYKLKEGEEVEVSKVKNKVKKDTGKDFEVVFENDEFLVINKPAGLIVHGADHIEEITLADLLLKRYPELEGIGEEEGRPGIVHRLDKDASGLMVIARNQSCYDNLKKQFQDRKVGKNYLALVYGIIDKEYDEINFPIKRSSGGNRQAAVPESFVDEDDEAKEAITSFEVLKRFVNYTLLSVKIKTGRKHQIRVHLSALGYPILGDDLYKNKKSKELNKKLNLGRIFLVAYKLSFKDLLGEEHKFEIKLPNDLNEFLENIK